MSKYYKVTNDWIAKLCEDWEKDHDKFWRAARKISKKYGGDQKEMWVSTSWYGDSYLSGILIKGVRDPHGVTIDPEVDKQLFKKHPKYKDLYLPKATKKAKAVREEFDKIKTTTMEPLMDALGLKRLFCGRVGVHKIGDDWYIKAADDWKVKHCTRISDTEYEALAANKKPKRKK